MEEHRGSLMQLVLFRAGRAYLGEDLTGLNTRRSIEVP
jgi:hypothetical protein